MSARLRDAADKVRAARAKVRLAEEELDKAMAEWHHESELDAEARHLEGLAMVEYERRYHGW